MYDTINKQYLTYCTYYINFKEAEYIQYNYLHKIVHVAPQIRDAINTFTRQKKLLQKKKDSCRKKRQSKLTSDLIKYVWGLSIKNINKVEKKNVITSEYMYQY